MVETNALPLRQATYERLKTLWECLLLTAIARFIWHVSAIIVEVAEPRGVDARAVGAFELVRATHRPA